MKFQRMTRISRALCVVAFIALVQGCGGGGSSGGSSGGGGGSGGGTPPPVETLKRDTPLPLDAAALGVQFDVPTWAQEYVNEPMQVAQHAILEVAAIARAGTLQMQTGCARYTLTDADGNGVPSAGDTLTVQYTACSIARLDEAFSGTLTIRLASVDNASLGIVSGTVDFGAGLVPVNDVSYTWLGSLNFRRTDDLAKEQLDVSATTADDLRKTNKQKQVEALQHPQFTRVLRRDTTRATLTGTMTVASDRLSGRIDIDAQLSSYLNTYPDSGSIRVTGASNSRITLPTVAAGPRTLQAALDSNGDGVADSTRAVDWNYLVMGLLLFEQTTAGSFAMPPDDTQLRLINEPNFDKVDVSAPFRFQFGRPLSADNPVYVKLVEQGNTTNPPPEIAADAEIHGGLLLVRPRQPLRYGQFYGVVASNASDFSSRVFTLRAATGSAVFTSVAATLMSVRTDDALLTQFSGADKTSLAMPGRPITVSASVPNALSLPLKYQWSQLSGPTVELTSPTTASTAVRVADASAPGIASATLQLKVTDAIGRSTTTPVAVQLANLNGLTTVWYVTSGPDSYVGGNQTRAVTTQTGTFGIYNQDGNALYVRYDDTRPGTSIWTLQLTDANGRTPAVGTYANAFAPTALQPGPRMSVSVGGGSCEGAGSFSALESEVDNLGNYQRLAVDFEYHCTSGTAQLGSVRGSVRVNSSLPIQP